MNTNNNIENQLNDPNIRKFKKKISQDYWMLKLHVWCHGSAPQFKGYCVLFWSTWAIIFLAPFILLGKSCEFLISLVANIFKMGFNSNAPTEVKKKLIRPPDSVIILIWGYLVEKQWAPADLTDQVKYFNLKDLIWCDTELCNDDCKNAINWIIKNFSNSDDLQKLVHEINEKIAAIKEKNRIRAEKLAKFHEQKQKIVNFFSPFVKPAMWLSALAVGYFPIHWIFVYVPMINWHVVLNFSLLVGGIFLIVAAATLGIAGIVKGIQAIIAKLNAVEIPKESARTESHFFNNLISAIRETFSFFYDTGRLLYTKECPLIEYTEDETTGIQRNKIEKSE